jgi:cysteate synthase
MRVYMAQNRPFTLIHDSWKAQSRELVALDPEEGRRSAEVILAKVLANRKPPYSLAGGVFDVLRASGGDTFACTNDDIMYWLLQFRNLEGYDLLPAPCAAVAALAKAVQDGVVKKDECIMLNCTGGGMLGSMAKGFILKEPDLVLDPSLPEEEIIAAVDKLF